MQFCTKKWGVAYKKISFFRVVRKRHNEEQKGVRNKLIARELRIKRKSKKRRK